VAKILCVDDDSGVVDLKKKILEDAGHFVITCLTTQDAIRELSQATFDAVVTDWRIGSDRGRAVVAAAKANASVPVIVVSGYVSEAFHAAEPLADLYLEKPVDPRELVEVLRTLLKSRPSAEEGFSQGQDALHPWNKQK
jgi:DNA-binding response OmpR family regulator